MPNGRLTGTSITAGLPSPLFPEINTNFLFHFGSTYLPTTMCAYIQALCVHTSKHYVCIHLNIMYAYIHTYMCAYIHTCMYIHTKSYLGGSIHRLKTRSIRRLKSGSIYRLRRRSIHRIKVILFIYKNVVLFID